MNVGRSKQIRVHWPRTDGNVEEAQTEKAGMWMRRKGLREEEEQPSFPQGKDNA